MKRLFFIAVIGFLAYNAWNEFGGSSGLSLPGTAGSSAVSSAFKQQRSDVQVKGSGTVVRLLSDDNDGSRHQRFILGVGGSQTILVAHNIDLAPRINDLAIGDTVGFYGEYEWNAKGGVVHWTHHDPGGRHVGGWLKHGGRTYQ
jgi:hypothetical protein